MLDQAILALVAVILAAHGAWFHWKAGEQWEERSKNSAWRFIFLGATAFCLAFLLLLDHTLLGKYFRDPLSWKVGVYAVLYALATSVICVGVSTLLHCRPAAE